MKLMSRVLPVIALVAALIPYPAVNAANGVKDFSVGEIIDPMTGSHQIYSIAGEYRMDGFMAGGSISMYWRKVNEPSTAYRYHSSEIVAATGGVWTAAPGLIPAFPSSPLPAAGTKITVRWQLIDDFGNVLGTWNQTYTVKY